MRQAASEPQARDAAVMFATGIVHHAGPGNSRPQPAPPVSPMNDLSDDGLPSGPPLARLLAVMARLRDPDNGCPWDLEQSFESIAPYTIEEAYEVAEAIASGDRAALKDELGDLLLQVVYHARLAEEEGSFRFDDVATAIADKRSEEHTSELQSLMRISYAVFCLKKKKQLMINEANQHS